MTQMLGWFKQISIGTVLTVGTLVAGFATTHGRDEQRMNDLERRITSFEKNGVRKSEIEARDKSMVSILQSIDTRLTTIERVLMEDRDR